jgi:NADH-quinone oxidoreductase subunit L
MHHEQDMRKMGNLRKYMPVTFITMMAGWLAICGIPIWAGFFSKDEILYKTFASPNLPQPWNYVLWIVGLITAVLTAVYMTRMMWMTFFGESRFHEDLHEVHAYAEHADDHQGEEEFEEDSEEHHALPADFKPHESPWTMTVPLIVLAVLSTVGGLVGVPYAMSSIFGAGDVNVFEHTLEPVIAKVGHPNGHEAPVTKPHASTFEEDLSNLYASTAAPKLVAAAATGGEHAAHSPEEISQERWLALLSVVLAASGILIGYFLFRDNPLRKMPKILEEKWRIDELYNGYIVDPLTTLSREGFWKAFDLGFIDGIVNGIGHFATELGNALRQIQVGFVRSYAAFILLGALIVIGYFVYYGLKLVG